jgi:hypothetical protein
MTIDPVEVDAKLAFAEQRMDELLALNGGDIPGAQADDRDRQIAEFFFHLVSATEVLAQYVNEHEGLGLAVHQVSVRGVSEALGASSPAGTTLGSLYVNIGRTPFPADPYTDDALVYRMILYRNHMTHHRRAPVEFTMPARTAHLHVDPVEPSRGPSRDTLDVELPRMLALVRTRCTRVLSLM